MKGLLSLLFFLSWIPGIACGVIWTRWIGLESESSPQGAGIIFSTVLVGMAVGNLFFRNKGINPLRQFAYCLGGFGLYGFLQFGIKLILPPSPISLPLSKETLQVILLLIPSFLLGGTLPTMGRILLPHLGEWIYYGLLGLGIGIGILLTGFIFIPTFGLILTNGLSSLIEVFIGGIALFLSRKGIIETVDVPISKASTPNTPLLLYLTGMTGFATIGMIGIWNRIITFFTGSTPLIQLLLLSLSLFGIALGSLLTFILSSQTRDPYRLLGWANWGGALLSLSSIPVITRIFFHLTPPLNQTSTFPLLSMILPTIPLGIMLPITTGVLTSKRKIGRSIGDLHAILFLGCALGNLLLGNPLISRSGYEKGVIPPFILFFMMSLIWISLSPRKGWKTPLLLSLLLFSPLLLFLLRNRPFSILNHPRITGESIFYREGPSNIVEVVKREGTNILLINGGLHTSTSKGGLRLQRLSSLLPLLFHEDARDILMLPLGTGITAGAIRSASLDAQVERVDCLETSEVLVESAKNFELYNRKIFEWPSFHLIMKTARDYLSTTQNSYDIIITGMIHPSGGIFEKEFYLLIKEKLNENGILCQWIPLDLLREEDFKKILKTSLKSFPYSTLWFSQPFGEGGSANTFLISSLKPLPIHWNRMEERIQKSKLEFENLGIVSSLDIFDCYIAGEGRLKTYVQNAPLLTSDHPDLEYSRAVNEYDRILKSLSLLREIPRSQWIDTVGPLREELEKRYRMIGFCIKGDIETLRGNTLGSLIHYRKAHDLLSSFIEPFPWIMEMIQREISTLEAFKEERFERLKNPPQEMEEHLLLGYLQQGEGRRREAILEYQKVLMTHPTHLNARYNLALLYQLENRFEEAVQEYNRVLKTNPSSSDALIGLGATYDAMGKSDLAINLFEIALRRHPRDLNIFYNLGEVYRKSNEIEKARKVWEKGLKIDPYNSKIHTGLGSLFASQGLYDFAEVEYLLALKTNPTDPEILGNLGILYAYMGNRESAIEKLEKALQLEPNNPRLTSFLEQLRESP